VKARFSVGLIFCVLVACEPGRPEREARPRPDAERVVAAWYRQPGHGGPVRWDGVSIVDLDTGAVEDRRLPEYAAGDVQFKIVRIADRLVFRGSRGRRYGTFSTDPGLEERPMYLGRSWYFVPSAKPGHVWLTSLDRRPRESRGLLKGVREVDLGGSVTAREASPPDGWVVGTVTDGFVYQGEDALRVWDLRTRRVVRHIPGVFLVAQDGDRLATCDVRCAALVVTDLEAGQSRRIDAPDGWAFMGTYDGSVAPGGGVIATALKKGGLYRLGLVDLEKGRAEIVRGARLDPSFAVSAWSASGEWVVFNSGGGDLAAYNTSTGAVRAFSLGDDHVVTAMTQGG
jgi:hypothetical protein